MKDVGTLSKELHHGSSISQQERFSRPTFPLLPFEIVSCILFQIFSPWDDHYTTDIGLKRLQESDDVLHASQVCRYWRFVALQLPTLWAKIIYVDFNSVSWMQELLRRSRDIPLEIRSNARLDQSPAFDSAGYGTQKWELVFREMQRIRIFHLCIQEGKAKALDHLVEALEKPAPLIKSLWVKTDSPQILGAELWRWPGQLFAGVAPRLRGVSLQGMGIPKNLLALNSTMKLRSLCISAAAGQPSLSPSEWLDVLEDQSQLSDVFIQDENDFTEDHVGQGAEHRQVVLPNLAFLTIVGQQGFINEVLPKIVSLRNQGAYILELDSRRPPRWDQDTSGILQGLARLFDTLRKDLEEGSPCCVWKIRYMSNSWLTIDAFVSELTDEDLMLSISMDLSTNEGIRDATIIAIFDLLRTRGLLTEADTLKLEFTAYLNSNGVLPAFLSLIATCSKASKLFLMGESTVDVALACLGLTALALSPNITSQKLLPNLDLLVYNEDQNKFETIDVVLVDFLARRCRDGCKIPRLQLRLKKPKYAFSLFSRHPILKRLDNFILKEAEEWNVDFRTPFSALLR